jgi:hypothetical protein
MIDQERNVDFEAKDYHVELETESSQLEIILASAQRKLKKEGTNVELTQNRIKAIRIVLGCNTEYSSVRAKIDEIRGREDSGVRRLPVLNKDKKNLGEDVESEYEYDVLNTLLMRVVEEVTILNRENDQYNLSLARKKGKALKEARDNTEYGKGLKEEKLKAA